MILNSLTLRSYRNLAETKITWNKQFNVIFGRNAQGKTNLIESIYLLGHLKSFRGIPSREMIQLGKERALVSANIEQKGVSHQLDIYLEKIGRSPRINGKRVNKLSDFIGYLRTVVFTPEELGCIRGFPAGRRSLLDRAILQSDPSYLDRIQEYDKTLRHRNQLLKQQADNKQISLWTESLARIGGQIRFDRLSYLERVEPLLCSAYREITSGLETATIFYPIKKGPLDTISKELLTTLNKIYEREKQYGLTLAGPHRDDFDFVVNNKSLRSYGSQGQQRSFLLAFKAAQVIDLESILKDSPILLLDDLASELDSKRQEGFFKFLLNRTGQIFLTSAQPSLLTSAVRQKANYYKVDHGTVTAMSLE